ncbi:MAG: NmrA family NAD(P)-binding protein [Terracidiphilus sp.]
MFVITGITGNIGGELARTLLREGRPVRAVVRDAAKGESWEQNGCEIAVADVNDAAALAKAFKGAEGVFILMPPVFDPSPGFSEARAFAANMKYALEVAKPGKVVYLSTIGADAKQENLLTQHTIAEQALRGVELPITFLRPAWFMENASWDVGPAREQGVVPSFLQPLDRAVPMVATADIARLAAELIQENWTGSREVELEGPRRITPNEIAATFARLLGREVKTEVVPRETWERLFVGQGMKNPTPRIQMLDGFNQGWIEFADGGAHARKGATELETVLKGLIAR